MPVPQCPRCHATLLPREKRCPSCRARLRSSGRAAGVVQVGKGLTVLVWGGFVLVLLLMVMVGAASGIWHELAG